MDAKLVKLGRGKTVQFAHQDLEHLLELPLGGINAKKVEKAMRAGKGVRIQLSMAELEGGSFFGSVGRQIGRSARSTGRSISRAANSASRGIKKVATTENLNKAVDGLRYANNAVKQLTGKKPSDIVIDEILGRVATPVIGATATKMLATEAKRQASKQGFGYQRPIRSEPRPMMRTAVVMEEDDEMEGGSIFMTKRGNGSMLDYARNLAKKGMEERDKSGGSFKREGGSFSVKGGSFKRTGGSFRTNSIHGGAYREPGIVDMPADPDALEKNYKVYANHSLDVQLDSAAMHPAKAPNRGWRV